MVYVGCAGKPEPAPHPVIPKPEERLHREPEIPEPSPEEPAPFEPVHSVELPLAMEVLELGFVELPEGAHLFVLGRRALSLVQVAGDAAETVDQSDLLPLVADLAELARRPQACLQLLTPPDRGPDPWLHLFSTALGAQPAAAAAFRIQSRRLVMEEALWMESEGGIGPCDAFQVAEQFGWPGRAWVVASDSAEPIVFHLENGGSLGVRTAGGGDRVFAGPWGEPLTARGDPELANLYLSSPGLPGEPDYVQELVWQSGTLRPGRRSRTFTGRVAAMLFLPEDGRAVVAEITEPYGTMLHILRAEDLWAEDVP
jgi:hypothetical protein